MLEASNTLQSLQPQQLTLTLRHGCIQPLTCQPITCPISARDFQSVILPPESVMAYYAPSSTSTAHAPPYGIHQAAAAKSAAMTNNIRTASTKHLLSMLPKGSTGMYV